ncbi:MAG: two-component system response regulator [Verrucomicrobiales bacterium]|nr:two-component system response regulator [Verrucomicrobiales bacterium]
MKQPILLVEDDENDVFFFKRAVEKAGISHPLQIARDGQEAIDYISGLQPFENGVKCPLPALIILDLNLPRCRGTEVLRWLRNSRNGRLAVVVILTSSANERDVAEAYDLGVNSYLVKPRDPDELVRMVSLLKSYWLDTNYSPIAPGLGSGLDAGAFPQ